MATFYVSLAGLLAGLAIGPVAQADMSKPSDHELISPYQGSALKERVDDAFNTYQRIVGTGLDGARTETIEGSLTKLRYDNPKGRSTLEIERNYRQALEGKGLVVDYFCEGRQGCAPNRNPSWTSINGINLGAGSDVRYFTGRLPQGVGHVYVSVAINPHRTYLHVAQPTDMQAGMVKVDTAALASALDSQGKVDLPGIFFDSGTARLQPASGAALEAAAALLRQRPSLAIEVVGHTDNQGGEAFNLALSRDRAAAVVGALAGQGIEPKRLSARGMGLSQPVADNSTEAGRARNRRVELVRR